MEDSLAVIIIIVVGAILPILIIVMAVRVTKAQQEKYQQFATSMGLNFIPGSSMFRSWRIEGSYSGVEVNIRQVTEGSGNNRHTYLQFQAKTPKPIGFTLNIAKENFLTRLGKKFLGEDIQTGNPEFDDNYLIMSNNKEEAAKFLNKSGVQGGLRLLLDASSAIQIQDNSLAIKKPTYKFDEIKTRQTLDRMVSAVKSMKA